MDTYNVSMQICVDVLLDSILECEIRNSVHSNQVFVLLCCSSTMPVASTVRTPELFKGCLKEYQLKGLQWLVNCYEQVVEQS